MPDAYIVFPNNLFTEVFGQKHYYYNNAVCKF